MTVSITPVRAPWCTPPGPQDEYTFAGQVAGLPVYVSPMIPATRRELHARSPARARRRLRRGYPQHHRTVECVMQVYGTLYMHPDVYRRLVARVAREEAGAAERARTRRRLPHEGW